MIITAILMVVPTGGFRVSARAPTLVDIGAQIDIKDRKTVTLILRKV